MERSILRGVPRGAGRSGTPHVPGAIVVGESALTTRDPGALAGRPSTFPAPAECPGVTYRRIVVALALAGTGACEQWKAPSRIRALEARVDKLTAALEGSGAGSEGTGSGSDAAGSDADGHAGSDADAAPDGHAKNADAGAKKADAHAPATHAAAKEVLAPAKEETGASVPHATNAHSPWAYDGTSGPAEWGHLDPAWSTCGTGKAQSPVEITPKAPTASAIVFDYKPTPARVIASGQALQVKFAPGSSISIDDHRYALIEFHVHTPSEHVIAGEHYPMEIQLVHKDAEGKLAVIGVMYDQGASSKALSPVWSKWPAKHDVETKLGKALDPSQLLPENRTVFRYQGSLTTPPCSEGVVWNVMRRPMTDSRASIDLLKQHLHANARPPQELNGREVL